jgi:hypothetical protein
MTRIHGLYLEAVLFEDLEGRDPADRRRLRGDRGDATSFEPPCLAVEVKRETAKGAYRILVPILQHGNEGALPSRCPFPQLTAPESRQGL